MGSQLPQSDTEPDETLPQAVARVMSEAQDWRRIMSLDGDASVTVYLDMKSPHAYIAVRPSLETIVKMIFRVSAKLQWQVLIVLRTERIKFPS